LSEAMKCTLPRAFRTVSVALDKSAVTPAQIE
jgi:hypothetical protein